MRGDAVGTGGLAHRGCFDRTRLDSAARLPQSRKVVYVHVEPQMSRWHFFSPFRFAPTFVESKSEKNSPRAFSAHRVFARGDYDHNYDDESGWKADAESND